MVHRVTVAVFTSRAEKCVGEGREEDTTEVFRLKVTVRGVCGSKVARCTVGQKSI